MQYLRSFSLASESDEVDFMLSKASYQLDMACYSQNNAYPFHIFPKKSLRKLEFEPITIFYGNNGSGKSTVLNIIAEKLNVHRSAPFNNAPLLENYLELCDYRLAGGVPYLPDGREIITSDGVFERVLDIRRLNDGIDDRRKAIVQEYISEVTSEEPNLLRGLDDFDRWKRAHDMRNRNLSQSQFLRKNLVRNVAERSNGESALAYFVDSIRDNTLYLLDEPENSLSAENQLKLKYFIEDCVREHGCQFVISSHSPFLLSIEHATIYDIDAVPPRVKRWVDLESVRTYFDFFRENEWKFEK